MLSDNSKVIGVATLNTISSLTWTIALFLSDGTPSGYSATNSKRALTFAPPSPVGKPFLHPDCPDYHFSSESAPTDILLEEGGEPEFITEDQKPHACDEESAPLETSSKIGRRSRSPTNKTMTATPTYGHSCFPFAVNCR